MPIRYVNSYGLEPLLKDSFTFTIDINSLTVQSRGCSNSSRIGPDRIVFYFVNRPSLSRGAPVLTPPTLAPLASTVTPPTVGVAQ